MSVRAIINLVRVLVLVLSGLVFSSSAIAQTLNSKKLMEIADSIYDLSKSMGKYNIGPNVLDEKRWKKLVDDVKASAVEYQLAALNALIVEQNVNVDLRQFRFGNKLAHMNNREEMESQVFSAFFRTQTQVTFFEKVIDLYPSFSPIHQRLSAINSQVKPYATSILAKYETKKR